MDKKIAVVVSKCLLGCNCKYNGGNNYNQKVIGFLSDKIIIPVCPEEAGGLSTPRKPCEIVSSGGVRKVVNEDGEDVTANFIQGAKLSLDEAVKHGAAYAIFKAGSPSCGCGKIYDGTFTHTLIKGNGVTAQLFLDNGIEVRTEEEIE